MRLNIYSVLSGFEWRLSKYSMFLAETLGLFFAPIHSKGVFIFEWRLYQANYLNKERLWML